MLSSVTSTGIYIHIYVVRYDESVSSGVGWVVLNIVVTLSHDKNHADNHQSESIIKGDIITYPLLSSTEQPRHS